MLAVKSPAVSTAVDGLTDPDSLAQLATTVDDAGIRGSIETLLSHLITRADWDGYALASWQAELHSLLQDRLVVPVLTIARVMDSPAIVSEIGEFSIQQKWSAQALESYYIEADGKRYGVVTERFEVTLLSNTGSQSYSHTWTTPGSAVDLALGRGRLVSDLRKAVPTMPRFFALAGGLRATALLEKVFDSLSQPTLIRIALEDKDPRVRETAINRIADQGVLVTIALEEPHIRSVAEDAVRRLNDQDLLAKVVIEASSWSLALAAAKRITDQDTLADLVEMSRYSKVIKLWLETGLNF